MVFVYVENAHNLSLYTPVLTYYGANLDELKTKLRTALSLPPRIRVEVYDRRLGAMQRKLLKALPQNLTDVYVLLKVEDEDAGNQ